MRRWESTEVQNEMKIGWGREARITGSSAERARSPQAEYSVSGVVLAELLYRSPFARTPCRWSCTASHWLGQAVIEGAVVNSGYGSIFHQVWMWVRNPTRTWHLLRIYRSFSHSGWQRNQINIASTAEGTQTNICQIQEEPQLLSVETTHPCKMFNIASHKIWLGRIGKTNLPRCHWSLSAQKKKSANTQKNAFYEQRFGQKIEMLRHHHPTQLLATARGNIYQV
jgi:hypothetical protein